MDFLALWPCLVIILLCVIAYRLKKIQDALEGDRMQPQEPTQLHWVSIVMLLIASGVIVAIVVSILKAQ